MNKIASEKKLDSTLLIIRITLGVVIFGHGAQKLLGWFGGYGYDGMIQYFTGTIGLPYGIALLIILGESLGAIALIIGFFGRFMAASIFIIIAGALVLDHAKNGFYMNWFGNQTGEGYEFDLLIFALSLVVILHGSGAFSVDTWIKKYLKTELI